MARAELQPSYSNLPIKFGVDLRLRIWKSHFIILMWQRRSLACIPAFPFFWSLPMFWRASILIRFFLCHENKTLKLISAITIPCSTLMCRYFYIVLSMYYVTYFQFSISKLASINQSVEQSKYAIMKFFVKFK